MKNLLTATLVAMSLTASAQHSLVKDIAPGTDNGTPISFSVFKNKLYFLAWDGAAANGSVELWSHDGATNTTSMVADINSQNTNPAGPYYQTCVFGNELYFTAYDNNTNGSELWKYDGVSTPVLAKDIVPGGSSDPRYITALNGKLYFEAFEPGTGREMHSYDPATNTATLLKDINPGSFNCSTSKSVVYNGKLYFAADDGTGAYTQELWEHDPGANTTTKVPGLPLYGMFGLHVFNNKLYFLGREFGQGFELCVFDGTNISRAVDIAPGAADGASNSPSELTQLIDFKNKLYFRGGPGAPSAFMCYDPATSTASPGFPSSQTAVATNAYYIYAGKLYFMGNQGVGAGMELCRWDGSNAPQLAADIVPGIQPSSPTFMTIYNQHLYFTAETPTEGRELFKFYDSDVTSVSPVKFTAMINVYPNPSPSIFSMDMNLEQPATFAVQVFDMAGKKVYNGGMHSYESGKHQLSVPATAFAPGNYTLQLRTNSEAFYTTQIVKQ